MSRPGFTGPCYSCCQCTGPAIAYVQRSASKSKLGYTEFVDPSTPPKYYLTETWSSSGGGACDGGGYLNCNGTVSTAGSSTYDPITGVCTGTDSRNGGGVVSSCGQTYFYAYCWALGGDCNSSDDNGPNQPVDSGPQYTQTTYNESWTCTGCSASATASLSDEYTTSALETNTINALPAWGDMGAFGYSMPGEIAGTSLAGNETSFSVSDGKYMFAIPPSPTGYFLLSWTQRFTPDGGGAPTDSPMSYTWDGTIPPDYNPDDMTTWIQTSIYEVDHPATAGGISLINITINCGGGPIGVL